MVMGTKQREERNDRPFGVSDQQPVLVMAEVGQEAMQ
jgi:hypothetical protein